MIDYSDKQRSEARDRLDDLLDSRSGECEEIDRLADYLGDEGVDMCSRAGYVLPLKQVIVDSLIFGKMKGYCEQATNN